MTTDFLRRGYPAFGTASVILFFLSFVKGDFLFDLQLHDTYFVFGFACIAMPLAVWMGMSGAIYWLFRSLGLVGWLTVLHTFLTITLALLLTFMAGNDEMYPGGQLPPEDLFRYNRLMGQFLVPGVMLWLIAQALFFMNIAITLFNKGQRGR